MGPSVPGSGLLWALWNFVKSGCHLYYICFTSHPTCHWSFNPRIRVLRNSHNQQSWEEQIFQIFTLIAIFRVSAAAGSVGPRVITLPGTGVTYSVTCDVRCVTHSNNTGSSVMRHTLSGENWWETCVQIIDTFIPVSTADLLTNHWPTRKDHRWLA